MAIIILNGKICIRVLIKWAADVANAKIESRAIRKRLQAELRQQKAQWQDSEALEKRN